NECVRRERPRVVHVRTIHPSPPSLSPLAPSSSRAGDFDAIDGRPVPYLRRAQFRRAEQKPASVSHLLTRYRYNWAISYRQRDGAEHSTAACALDSVRFGSCANHRSIGTRRKNSVALSPLLRSCLCAVGRSVTTSLLQPTKPSEV